MSSIEKVLGFNKTQEKELVEKVNSLDRYPGPLADYNDLKGQEYIQIDTKRPNKWVQVDGEIPDWWLLNELIKNGCVGFIHYAPPYETYMYAVIGGYGIPVKVKPPVEVIVAVK